MTTFTSDNQRQQQRDFTLLHQPGSVTLPADRLAVLTSDIRVPFRGTFAAGTIAEVFGDTLRFDSGRLTVRCVDIGGVLVSAVTLTVPYVPEPCEMVVSPFTGALIPARGQTARRYVLAKEMVR